MASIAYVIVGGTAGIGLASADALAAQGANVALVGRGRERAEAAAQSLSTKYGVRSVAVPGDASSSRAEAERVVAKAVAALGPIAGLTVTTGTDSAHSRRPLEAMSDADWTAAFEDSFMGTVRSCLAIIPYLIDRGSGSIVTTAAYTVRAPDRAAMPYSTLKAAVAVFTKGLARTYGAQGIQAKCIGPGAVETEKLHQTRRRFAKEKGIPTTKR